MRYCLHYVWLTYGQAKSSHFSDIRYVYTDTQTHLGYIQKTFQTDMDVVNWVNTHTRAAHGTWQEPEWCIPAAWTNVINTSDVARVWRRALSVKSQHTTTVQPSLSVRWSTALITTHNSCPALFLSEVMDGTASHTSSPARNTSPNVCSEEKKQKNKGKREKAQRSQHRVMWSQAHSYWVCVFLCQRSVSCIKKKKKKRTWPSK